MALPEFVTPVLSVAGPAALLLVILRFGPDAVLRLLAGFVAIVTRDPERGERCLEVLRVLRGQAAPDRPRTLTGKRRTGQRRAPGPAAPGGLQRPPGSSPRGRTFRRPDQP